MARKGRVVLDEQLRAGIVGDPSRPTIVSTHIAWDTPTPGVNEWGYGQQTAEITAFGDGHRTFIYENPLPVPVCITCKHPLTKTQHCDNIDCPIGVWDVFIPVPDWSQHDCQYSTLGECLWCGRREDG